MIDLNEGNPPGATPLDRDEALGLKLSHISTRAELDEAEQQNITAAKVWLLTARPRQDLLSVPFCQLLHKKMFARVWQWAGQFRESDKNIGIHWPHIREQLKLTFDDTTYWLENSVFDPDELLARFHHRLVEIHPFPNGNGRCGRLMTDLLVKRIGVPPLTWGAATLDETEAREKYLKALRAADSKNFAPLVKYVRL